MTFEDVDRRYAELKQQYDAGTLSAEAVDAALKEMMVQDDQGRWWAKSRETGAWSYHDGTNWVKATPPVYRQPTQWERPQAAAQPAAGKPVSTELSLVFYVLSFLIPFVGIVVWFVYRGKPFESDRKMAKIALAVAAVAFVLYTGILG
jgi:hypothetical protein